MGLLLPITACVGRDGNRVASIGCCSCRTEDATPRDETGDEEGFLAFEELFDASRFHGRYEAWTSYYPVLVVVAVVLLGLRSLFFGSARGGKRRVFISNTRLMFPRLQELLDPRGHLAPREHGLIKVNQTMDDSNALLPRRLEQSSTVRDGFGVDEAGGGIEVVDQEESRVLWSWYGRRR